jgi:hypothetical protein
MPLSVAAARLIGVNVRFAEFCHKWIDKGQLSGCFAGYSLDDRQLERT